MSLVSILSLLWPALLLISLIPLVLMGMTERGYSQRANLIIGLIGVLLLISIYQSSPLSMALRWSLTVIGFAVPLALGVISIQYIVEETSAPI